MTSRDFARLTALLLAPLLLLGALSCLPYLVGSHSLRLPPLSDRLSDSTEAPPVVDLPAIIEVPTLDASSYTGDAITVEIASYLSSTIHPARYLIDPQDILLLFTAIENFTYNGSPLPAENALPMIEEHLRFTIPLRDKIFSVTVYQSGYVLFSGSNYLFPLQNNFYAEFFALWQRASRQQPKLLSTSLGELRLAGVSRPLGQSFSLDNKTLAEIPTAAELITYWCNGEELVEVPPALSIEEVKSLATFAASISARHDYVRIPFRRSAWLYQREGAWIDSDGFLFSTSDTLSGAAYGFSWNVSPAMLILRELLAAYSDKFAFYTATEDALTTPTRSASDRYLAEDVWYLPHDAETQKDSLAFPCFRLLGNTLYYYTAPTTYFDILLP